MVYLYSEPIKKGLQEVIFNLREAERLGKRQIKIEHFMFDESGHPIGYCNIGILRCMKEPVTRSTQRKYLFDSVFEELYNIPRDFLGERLPHFKEENEEYFDTFGYWVWKLNDEAGLTFGQTADWIETTFSLD